MLLGSKAVWTRIQTLASIHPSAAGNIVCVAPWNNLPEEVRTTILNNAGQFDVCTAIAIAQGQQAAAPITAETAATFFAALKPDVWNAMNAATQRQWLDALLPHDAHLAIRSIGPRPELLAKARLDDNLVDTIRRYAPDAATLRRTLFPAALGDASANQAARLIAEMLEAPADSGAFFCITSHRRDPGVMDSTHAGLWMPADPAAVIAVQCSNNDRGAVHTLRAVLSDTLHGRSWRDLRPTVRFWTTTSAHG